MTGPSGTAGDAGRRRRMAGHARAFGHDIKRISSHIGERIRQRRAELGLTQEQLGQALGISYQQVQKYETAANRVSAGRLYELARECGVDISYFFEGFEDSAVAAPLPHGGHNRAAIELVRNFLALDDETLRAAVSGLLKALRERGDGRAQPDGRSS